jgi:non-ribosomal peptide synthetase component E (peptide arylation enzyme)
MIEYSFNIKSLAQYDSDVFSDMADSMIDGRNGDEFYVMEQTMDMDDEGYIIIDGRWSKEIADAGFEDFIGFRELE